MQWGRKGNGEPGGLPHTLLFCCAAMSQNHRELSSKSMHRWPQSSFKIKNAFQVHWDGAEMLFQVFPEADSIPLNTGKEWPKLRLHMANEMIEQPWVFSHGLTLNQTHSWTLRCLTGCTPASGWLLRRKNKSVAGDNQVPRPLHSRY